MIGNIFDSHAHYDDEKFDEDRDVILSSLPSQGICAVVNCASDLKSSAFSAELSEKYGKTVVLKTSVDPSIIGGMVLYVGNEMLDASVKARFEGLKKQLKTIQL